MKPTIEQLQEQRKDRQEQYRVYQQKAEAVAAQIRNIQEQIDALQYR
jgi:chromosome segregation ATPase